jgi:uncharacterized membrane protein
MSQWTWLWFALGTVLCWGAYAPTIHEGGKHLGSPWKVILCVGAAYFVLAVIVPLVILKVQGTSLDFNARGTTYSSIGGALGALGAIFIVAALRTGGTPLIVPAIVFGGAPLVNVIVSSIYHPLPPEQKPHPLLYVGFILAAIGAAMVLYFKPGPGPR